MKLEPTEEDIVMQKITDILDEHCMEFIFVTDDEVSVQKTRPKLRVVEPYDD